MFQGGRTGQGNGVVASFRLVSKNLGIRCFLHVGVCKSGGHSLLLVGVGEIGESVLPSGWCL
jgi:hypothetical protein